MAREREFEGATLQEALGKASAALGIPEPDLHFEILDTGRRGLFGIGAKSVRVRVEPLDDAAIPEASPPPSRTQRARQAPARGAEPRGSSGEQAPERSEERAPGRRRESRRSEGRASKRAEERAPQNQKPEAKPSSEECANLETTVRRMLELMDLDLTARAEAVDGGVRLELEGKGTKRLLEKDAELLSALQFLLNRMARRAWPGAGRIQLTCDGYRSRRDQEIIELAREVAGQVAGTGESKRLQPMNPYERRLVHIAVREFADLSSRSEGNGFLKRIRISKK